MRLIDLLNPFFLPESSRNRGDLAGQREVILQFTLEGATLTAAGALAFNWFRTPITMASLPQLIVLAVFLVCFLILTFSRQLKYGLRAGILAVLVVTLSLASTTIAASLGTGMVYAIAFITLMAALFGPKAGGISFFGLAVLQSALSLLVTSGYLVIPDRMSSVGTVVPDWVRAIPALILTALISLIAISQLTRFFAHRSAEERKQIEALKLDRTILERRSEDRARELSRKTNQLEASRKLVVRLADAGDADQITNTTAQVIQQMGYHQVNVFLNDERKEYTILRASTGETGKKLLESGYRLRIGDGIVGTVASSGKLRVVRDTEGSSNYLSTPALPDTRAELAVPLLINGQVAGVLDVQSTSGDAFVLDEIDEITNLSSLITLGIEKVNLLEQLKNSESQFEATTGQATRSAWDIHLKSGKRGYAFRYKHARIERNASHTPESLQALKVGTTVISTPPASAQSTQPFATLAVPIKIRNQTLGVINLRVAAGRVSSEMISLVEGIVNRLSASLENARLLEELQSRAERERLVGEIASRVRAANDIDSILRTTAGELGRALDVSEVVIELMEPTTSSPPSTLR